MTQNNDNGWVNLGTKTIKKLSQADFPEVGAVLRDHIFARSDEAVDVMLVNPPSPDGGIWIRTQHRVGRRSRENMVWPQCSLAQLASMLHPDYSVHVVDAIAERMTWDEFQKILEQKRPKYYLTQVTAPTLTNDMYGCFLAKSLGAKTIGFGTHVTPMTIETMRPYPSIDFVLRGEPELTLRELVDTFEGHVGQNTYMEELFRKTDPSWQPTILEKSDDDDAFSYQGKGKEKGHGRHSVAEYKADLSNIKGLAWRQGDEVIINHDRPFISNLDDLPLPMHHLLPFDKYLMPLVKGPYTFILTSRGCPAGCKYCIKHVSYNYSVRVRSPENIMDELWDLKKLGLNNIHMYADLFTVSRDQVMGLCKLMISEGINIKWTCNSRVDYVDKEMLQLMAKAGNWVISWGIESSSKEILKRAHKGAYPDKARQALLWSREAGIMNWGYFIIGLPGETEETIRQTIAFSKNLPIDIALFHIAAPYPGTPFFYDVVKNGWFRPGTKWEEVDMDKSTVLDYPNLSAEQLNYWQKRATREWAFRPAPVLTMLKGMNTWAGFKSAVSIGLQTLSFVSSND
ncbi:MAG: radical SAM protein [Anaerolineaceae bacterium 4572_78]|nr:MAG: radical SAM protein [Anaerolineaceae bacterium 4572_78]